MQNQGYELGWDSELEYQESSFIVLPEGEYDFEVIEFERQRHQGSEKLPPCNKAVVHLRVTAPNGDSTIIFHNLFLHTRTAGLLSNFFVGIGQMKPGETIRMDWGRVIGSRGRAQVVIRKWIGNDGRERTNNQIERFIEPSETTSTPAYQAGNF